MNDDRMTPLEKRIARLEERVEPVARDRVRPGASSEPHRTDPNWKKVEQAIARLRNDGDLMASVDIRSYLLYGIGSAFVCVALGMALGFMFVFMGQS
ncbi:hypothetical protein [Palleronia sp. LCG004]|uniref:hypothetical protein n=1 Tax=Palleronia sp. LCG004 TaxID=3079304 RepID=UPI0029439400|nr:hypothetical protein [Palleronia sp. LCG004]WOI56926.1 hypothetical protein RVY76_03775 [Palleronia sp. LCG004]